MIGVDRIKTPNVSVIVPSLNPDDKLKCVVEGLIAAGFSDIILTTSNGQLHTPNAQCLRTR